MQSFANFTDGPYKSFLATTKAEMAKSPPSVLSIFVSSKMMEI